MNSHFSLMLKSLAAAALSLGFFNYAAAQEVRVKPATSSVNLGEEFVIEVEVANVTNLYGFQFDLIYNPNVIEYVSFSYGPFLSRNAQDPTFCLPPDVSPGLINNCACTRIGAVGGVSGTGILGSARFRVIAGGQSNIILDIVTLVDSNVDTIPCTISPGIVYVLGQHPAVITTGSVSGITYQSAISGGTIGTDGGAEITHKGVCWSTSENPTIANAHTDEGTGNWPFDSQVTGLTENTVYHVRAYATNVTGTSYGADIQFQTAVYDPPGAFNLLLPAHVSTVRIDPGASVLLSWEASAGATGYDLYFGTDPNPPIMQPDIQGTTWGVEVDAPGGPYYWTVVAKSPGGETPSLSGIWSFSTEAIELGPFNLLSPADGIRVEKAEYVTLTWEDAENADYYYVKFGTTPEPPMYGYEPVWANSYEVPVTPGETYFWDIVAIRDAWTWTDKLSRNGPRHFHVAQTDDFVGTWDGQGVYYRNSDTLGWSKLASPASQIAVGDLDCDGIDDIIGIWPGQGGVWVFLSSTKTWVKLGSTPTDIAAGDMDGDGCDEFVGTWDGQGVYYLTEIGGSWVKLASPATLIAVGNLDADHRDDLVGIWPTQGGVWVKYSSSGAWEKISSTARDITVGDMDGDGRDDLLATWDGQGVYFRNSLSGAWVKMASQADRVTCGDLDADGKDDLIGIWPTQGGVWVKYSKSGTWAKLSSTARDIAAGAMRPQMVPGPAAVTPGEVMNDAGQGLEELPMPMGGSGEGPEIASSKRDLSDRGPGGSRFLYIQDLHLDPDEDPADALARIPGPGEAGFIAEEQKYIFPADSAGSVKEPQRDLMNAIKPAPKRVQKHPE